MSRIPARWLVTGCVVGLALAVSGGALTAQRGETRGAGITLYAEANYRGLNASFRNDEPDLRKFNMNDRVASLQMARGEVWEVCENINYKGRCRTLSGDEPDLGRISWGGLISSLRRVRDNNGRGRGRNEDFPPSQFRPRLILFDNTGFRGRSFPMSDASPTLGGFGNRAGSVQVYGGAWQLCDGPGFRGHCVTVNDSIGDLGRIGMRDKVSSARPVGR